MDWWKVENLFQAEQLYKHVLSEIKEKGVSAWQKIDPKTRRPMSKKQRGALHIWCDQYAQALNDAGLLRKVHRLNGCIAEVPWSMVTFKEDVYKVMLEALTKKTSTEDQDTIEPNEVAKIIGLHFAEKRGVNIIEWPSNR